MFGCGLRLFSKGVSNVYFSYRTVPWYTQYANVWSDTFARDLVSLGWKGQPPSSGIPWQNSDRGVAQFLDAREAAAFRLCFESRADQ